MRIDPAELLARLMATGVVYFDREYVGVASDGTEVSIGTDKESALRYLASHPTPDTW